MNPADPTADSRVFHVWRCFGCLSDFIFAEGQSKGKCPMCGSGAWVRRAFAPPGMEPAGSKLRITVLNRDGLKKEEQRIIYKAAGQSGRRARERLIIDHHDPEKTVKKHVVEEWDGSTWVVVHEHSETHVAKHR